MINRVILVGNLTRDAEAIATSGKPMTRMRLATNHRFRDADGESRENAEFHTIISFGKLAEICALYCARGRRVYVEGRLRTREYEGGDGLKRVSTEIVADTVKLIQPRSDVAGGEAAEAVAASVAEPVASGATA